MESFAKLKRRTTDLMDHNIPSMPSMPKKFPGMPSMPKLPKMKSSSTMKGTWQHISIPPIPRSSHSLNVVSGTAYIFGGEVEARKPVDNDMHLINLPFSGAPADYYSVPAKPSSKTQFIESEPIDPLEEVPLASPSLAGPASANESEVPCARLGHATAVIGTRIFLFGGRSAASETLDETGRVWVFETKTHTWSYLDPHRESHIPPARSCFAVAATDKPRDFSIKPIRRSESWKAWAEGDSADVGIPQRPIPGHVAATASDEEEDGFGTFVIHGGFLKDGARASDVWAFDVRSRIWKELPSAPGPARGGAALAIAKSRLYRFGGFDGESEQGGQLDVLELQVDEFSDRVSKGEVGVFARGEWTSLVPASQGGETGKLIADEWPGNRSVAGFELVMGNGGREYLVLLFGEKSPSDAGHEAAGTFWGDVWTFQVPPVGMTTASVTDAVWQAIGKKTGEGKWTKVSVGPHDDEEHMDVEGPGERGWFAATPMADLEENALMLFGGIDEKNRRLGDGWIFRLG